MTNNWYLDDANKSVAIIEVWDYTEKIVRKARVDVADVAIADSFPITWYAHKTRGNKAKWYVMGKPHGRTIGLHRIIMGVKDPKVEVDHRDSDGLNNCRGNLRTCTHKQNLRFRNPDRDWAQVDRADALAIAYRAERALAKEIATEFGLQRQTLWHIRAGKTLNSPAAVEYHKRAVERGIVRYEILKMGVSKQGKFGVARNGQGRGRV